MWTLQTAAPVCQVLETIALQFGYHVALGGGVLYKGQSRHDMDVQVFCDSRRSHDCDPTALLRASTNN